MGVTASFQHLIAIVMAMRPRVKTVQREVQLALEVQLLEPVLPCPVVAKTLVR